MRWPWVSRARYEDAQRVVDVMEARVQQTSALLAAEVEDRRDLMRQLVALTTRGRVPAASAPPTPAADAEHDGLARDVALRTARDAAFVDAAAADLQRQGLGPDVARAEADRLRRELDQYGVG